MNLYGATNRKRGSESVEMLSLLSPLPENATCLWSEQSGGICKPHFSSVMEIQAGPGGKAAESQNTNEIYFLLLQDVL